MVAMSSAAAAIRRRCAELRDRALDARDGGGRGRRQHHQRRRLIGAADLIEVRRRRRRRIEVVAASSAQPTSSVLASASTEIFEMIDMTRRLLARDAIARRS
jgi:hypothetical protein